MTTVPLYTGRPPKRRCMHVMYACLFASTFAWACVYLRTFYLSTDAEHSDGTLIIPQWECTKASRLCGCVQASDTIGGSVPDVLYDLVRLPVATCLPKGWPHLLTIRVTIDGASWLGNEFTPGEYACPRSICRVKRETDDASRANKLPASEDVFVTAAPTGTGRARSRPDQQMVMLALESPLRWPHSLDEGWLRNHNVTAVVRAGIGDGGFTPSAYIGTLPAWHISYSNADWEHYLRPPFPIDRKIRGVASFISNCDKQTKTKRLELLNAIEAAGIPVYSFGKCRTTHDMKILFPECVANQSDTSNGVRSPQFDFVKMCVIRRFMFAAAFENDVVVDYVTEKLFHPLLVGTVPVYAGAPNVHSYLPSADAAIVVKSFGDDGTAQMVADMTALVDDPRLYAKALEWKVRLAAKSMRTKSMESIVQHSFATLPCLLCDQIGRQRVSL